VAYEIDPEGQNDGGGALRVHTTIIDGRAASIADISKQQRACLTF